MVKLPDYFIILTSITYVHKAKYLLAQNNIRTYIIKLRTTTERRGCGYGLEINGNNLKNAVCILEKCRIKIVEIIKEEEGDVC